VETDPTVGIELPRLAQTLPKALSVEQAEKLIATARKLKYTYPFESYRNTALVALMLFTGLRRQEVANLRLEDVSL
jgi:site-specific recombinase XerD